MEFFVIAGAVSTVLFALANLPMVARAVRTKNLSSYSFSALLLGNVANGFHTIYVVHLPVGPIWVLHGFYLVTMAVMLALYLRHGARASAADSPSSVAGPDDDARG